MHDIVYDFAQFVNRNECASIEIGDLESSLISNFFDKVHHSILVFDRSALFPVSIFNAEKLRSLLIYGLPETCQPILRSVFDAMTCLRALRITGDIS